MRRKDLIYLFVIVYVVTTVLVIKNVPGIGVSGDNLTAMCLGSSLPSTQIDTEKTKDSGQVNTESTKQNTAKKETKKSKKVTGAPKVLIYHTHATESYLPSSAGNYHTTKEENTVRDAGNVLEEVLENNGINVIHDETLHDDPSYDNSYSRSYNTVVRLLKKYPTIECIIDLHRDATPLKTSGPVQTVSGKRCAVYSYVISNGTDTYSSNNAFLKKLNKVANEDYDGYSGEILERPYWYNQELCKKAILIEMGNNRNNIKEVRNCARIYGEILAEVLD